MLLTEMMIVQGDADAGSEMHKCDSLSSLASARETPQPK